MSATEKVTETLQHAANICDLAMSFNMPGEASFLIREGSSLEQARAFLQAKIDAYPLARACAQAEKRTRDKAKRSGHGG